MLLPDSDEPRSTSGRILCGGNVLVLDDFLCSFHAAAVWRHVCASQYRGVHRAGFERVFRHYDGECLMGPNVTFERAEGAGASERTSEPTDVGSDGDPPNGATDGPRVLFSAMLASDDVGRFLVGTRNWRSVNLRPYVYPVSSGLGWHTDGAKEAAFIYYAHPEWRAQWGGELLIAPPTGGVPASGGAAFQDFYGQFDDGRLLGKDIGTYVAPVPNRLVMLKGGVPHCIKRVDPAAGEAFRASVAGFFVAGDDRGADV